MTVFAWNKNHSIDTTMSPMDSIKYTKMFLQAGFMAMDPFTGEVKAWVGGINHDYFQYDHVNKNTKRQVGSTIKPLLYCLAVDKGFSPCGTLSTGAQQFSGAKTAYNAGGSKTGSLPMSTALALSINNAALFLLNQVGIEPFVDFAKKCGIESDMDPYPSVALGVSAISLYEMLQAYTMFPAGGVNTEPFFISRIEDKNGNLLKTFAPKQKEIISPQTAFKMVRMMQGVVDRGTAQRIRRYGLYGDIAGKTGTTNKQADAWFIGYTPQLLAGTWVGCDDRFLRFNSEAQGQGSAAALPIWINFFHKVFNDRSLEIKQDVRFKAPVPFSDCSGYNANTIADPNDTTSVQTVPIDQTSGDIIEEVTPEAETQP
jgi:penicillin-binding protein 1A